MYQGCFANFEWNKTLSVGSSRYPRLMQNGDGVPDSSWLTRSLKKFKKRSPEELKLRSEDTRRTSGNTTRNDPFPPFLILEAQTQIGISAMVIENKVKTLSITTFLLLAKKVLRATAFPEYYSSSSNHPIIVPSDSDIEDAFSSTNVPDYFPATPGNTSPDSSNDLTSNLLATLVFSPYYE
ncbi:hypothetical protein Tco_0260306 [Tanacetum coccineum]